MVYFKTLGSSLLMALFALALSQSSPISAYARIEPAGAQSQKVVVEKVKPQSKFKNNAEFVQAILPYAREVSEEYDIDPRIIIAHAALESNWGKAIPRHENGLSTYNIFGVKANKRSQKKVKTKTSEYNSQGKKRKSQANFRSYQDFSETFMDYIRIITLNRFKKALEQGRNPSLFFKHLQKGGYATDPNYAKELMRFYNHPLIKQIT